MSLRRLLPLAEDNLKSSQSRLRHVLQMLHESFGYSNEMQCDPWDFAVEIEDLRLGGVLTSDLRWLVCKGYIEHAEEITRPGEDRRSFRSSGKLNFARHSCLILTAEGVAWAREFLECCGEPARPALASQDCPQRSSIPRWDIDRRELSFEGRLVKRFKLPAKNQEIILTVFEEVGWVPRIDDPLPPEPNLDPKRRLHDTINSLNHCQKEARISFLGDGNGMGVRWEIDAPGPPSDPVPGVALGCSGSNGAFKPTTSNGRGR